MDSEMFESLKQSIKDAVAVSKGEKEPARRIVYSDEEVEAIKSGQGERVIAARLARREDDSAENVKALRERLELSQSEFARLIQVNVRTLQNWEQGHRRPTGPAAALLKLVSQSPQAALEALQDARNH